MVLGDKAALLDFPKGEGRGEGEEGRVICKGVRGIERKVNRLLLFISLVK